MDLNKYLYPDITRIIRNYENDWKLNYSNVIAQLRGNYLVKEIIRLFESRRTDT